uniref:Tyrosine-protein phosphatase 10D-like isoform X2 n=1 Tax=Crassostrea virginica TaxID=6565 RepID=A0A8B8AQF4_CRAVI|nr:tyrosine-protein phosphatase 10D-like isoform X2 [Crassostrea virginica]
MYLYWSLCFKIGLALLKCVEANLGNHCYTVNDCGGYSGASCLNGLCSCVFTIQDNQCTVDAKFSFRAIVVGVVCGTVILIFLIIIGILLYRNFRVPTSGSSSISEIQTYIEYKRKSSDLLCFFYPMRLAVYQFMCLGNKDVKKRDDLHSSKINTRPSGYMYLQVTKVIQIRPIKVESLKSHVHEFLRHDGLEVRKEYMHLDTLVTYSEATVGNLPQNIEKNRSAKVPYDFNRVKLLETSDYPGENYINASHVLQKGYIITQFPLRTTLTGFWRMIWEQNVSNIIMVAPLNELKKCHRYYSAQVGKKCIMGDLKVTVIASVLHGENLKIRKILLRRHKEKRTVTHFHIYALNQLILAKEFVENVKFIRSSFRFQTQPSPIVVHSGSAVEWSGVFVLVDYLIQRVIKGDDSVDIPAVTLQLLDERKSIITEEDYVLVYSCIREYVECNIKQTRISLDENEDVIDYEDIP